MQAGLSTLISLCRRCFPGAVVAALVLGSAWDASAQQQDPPRENQPGQGQGGPRPGGPGGPGGPGRGGFGGRVGFGGGPGGPGGGGGELMLLASEQVQKELELIDEQIKDFEKLREEQQEKIREMFSGMRDLAEDERRAKFESMRGKLEEVQKELKEKMNAVLMPHQLDRLKELNIQIRGMGALDDPEVAAELKITEEQKKELSAKREELGQKMREMFSAARGDGQQRGPSEEMRTKFQQMQTERTEKLLGVLTSEQRAKFEQMKGAKFEFDRSQMFGGRAPGGPGGGPGGPGGQGFRRPGERPEGGNRPEGDQPAGNRPTNNAP